MSAASFLEQRERLEDQVARAVCPGALEREHDEAGAQQPESMVKYCGEPLGSTTIAVPSLKDWAAEKVKTFDPDVVLTVPDPVIKLRALVAAILALL